MIYYRGEEGGPLKYYTRRVKVDDLHWFKGSSKTCLELIINAGSLRVDTAKTDNAACRITASVLLAKKEYLPDETVCRSERFSP